MNGIKGACVLTMAATIASFGCANVKVRKVDVDDRVQGRDDHVKGFRYYLTRPYLVVAKAVPVSTTTVPAARGTYQGETVLVALAPDEAGIHRVYDLACNPRLEIPSNQVKLLDAGAGAGAGAGAAESAGTTTGQALKTQRSQYLQALFAELETKFPPSVALTPEQSTALEQDLDSLVKEDAETWSDPNKAATQLINGVFARLSSLGISIGAEFNINDLAEMITADTTVPFPTAPTQPRNSGGATANAALANAADFAAAAIVDPRDGNPDPPIPEFQVAFLPDFEEQYAIRNRNFLSKTKYRYIFRNGTELESFAGAYDSTDLPVKILETVNSLVTAASNLARLQINPAANLAASKGLTLDRVNIQITYLIEPGIYRLQKSWERAAQAAHEGLSFEQVSGLFADMGLPIIERRSVVAVGGG